ncbi:MAG: hypothetical protein RL213_905 [Bacteroidota bacterium]|jgi:predicted O-methyltransferase YrrM
MDFLPAPLSEYIGHHTEPESELLKGLERETYAKVLMPRMVSGHLQGRVLSMISRMIRPKAVLEVGTFTGYSAICLAEGLAPGGVLHTIDINDELADMVNRYVSGSPQASAICCHWGNALDIIPALEPMFDLVFIDADKVNYLNYYEMVLPKVRSGGWIIADNVLWSGKILDSTRNMDSDTLALHRFNERVSTDNRVRSVLLPVRDGLMVLEKL